MSWSDVVDHYSRLVTRYGISHKSLDWGSVGSQRIRFTILTQIADLKGQSILDVGCGLADFWEFLQEQNIDVNYTGMDLTRAMIDKATERYAGLKLIHANIVDQDFENKQFDYVVASGIFAVLKGDEKENTKVIIRKMYHLARKGVAFNALSSWAPEKQAGEYQMNPADTVNLCGELTQNLVMRHDYMPHDFTIYLYKQADK